MRLKIAEEMKRNAMEVVEITERMGGDHFIRIYCPRKRGR
jgi:hypothetical protein